uniref:Uncharacterized protein n=1 Tax=Arundo donax TaxID=35708 RepID=A0A0A9CXV5_ARUDO
MMYCYSSKRPENSRCSTRGKGKKRSLKPHHELMFISEFTNSAAFVHFQLDCRLQQVNILFFA